MCTSLTFDSALTIFSYFRFTANTTSPLFTASEMFFFQQTRLRHCSQLQKCPSSSKHDFATVHRFRNVLLPADTTSPLFTVSEMSFFQQTRLRHCSQFQKCPSSSRHDFATVYWFRNVLHPADTMSQLQIMFSTSRYRYTRLLDLK